MRQAMDSERPRLEIGRPPVLVLTHACRQPINPHGEPAGEIWHRFEASFNGGNFHANVSADCMIREFVPFRDELMALNRDLCGTAKLETVEDDFALTATMDKLGHISWEGHVGLIRPWEPSDARLEFYLTDDQTSLPKLIAQLDEIIADANQEFGTNEPRL